MARRAILIWPDPVLRQPCAPVAPGTDVGALVDDMFETMYDAPGRGLAAPQIGVALRIFVMDCTWKEGPRTPMAFVNPVITGRSDTLAEAEEGCLSIPGLMLPVLRPDWIEMSWQTPEGTTCTARFDGFAATCAQHECDHLDGKVTFDRIPKDLRALAEPRFLESLT